MDFISIIPSLDGIDDDEAASDPQTIVISHVIKYLINKDLYRAPITCVEIDWDEIATDDLNIAQCKAIWKKMLNKSRFYRSAGEIMTTLLMNPNKKPNAETQKWNKQFLGAPSESQNNKDQKTQVDKDEKTQVDTTRNAKRKEKRALLAERQKKFGPKPLSAYHIFSQVKMKEGLKMKEASEIWKSIDPEMQKEFKQKAKEMHDDYVDNIENYILCNPDDEDAKTLLSSVKRQAKSKKVNGGEDSSDVLLSTSPEKKNKRKENDEEELSSSPRKKKKRDKNKSMTEWTGLSLYKSKKKEEIVLENPLMSDTEIDDKLEKKYKKMSAGKREKYETLAKVMNEES